LKPITAEVFQVGGGGLTSPEDAASYLIRIGEDAALVDAGCGRSMDRLFGHINSCGLAPEEISYLLLTHCHYDHTGGAAAVRDRTGCHIVAHELEAPFLEAGDIEVTAAKWYGDILDPLPIDEIIKGKEGTITLGGRKIRAIHCPGHSPGSLIYLMESEGLKVLFGQDVHGPINASLLSDPALYRRSLNLMAGLEADILCEGHYGIFRGKEEVRDFIRSFL
jgi:glyoxylase-like metal-dependent hydrolase (beta-lactamase superfamily II)